MKEKFITFTKDHRIPSKDELRGKTYCKYHNSWNHTTNACWVLEMSNKTGSTKGYSSSLKKLETMEIDEDPFPLVASVKTTSFDLRALIESKTTGKFSPRKVWVLKYCQGRIDRLKKNGLQFVQILHQGEIQ